MFHIQNIFIFIMITVETECPVEIKVLLDDLSIYWTSFCIFGRYTEKTNRVILNAWIGATSDINQFKSYTHFTDTYAFNIDKYLQQTHQTYTIRL